VRCFSSMLCCWWGIFLELVMGIALLLDIEMPGGKRIPQRMAES
jgi:hypothetical protein